ncbi:MAG: SDR family oxidoreductase [Actinobacteria bacterium]|nr:SDR family oxidoreductase [Actinomycetota bacterium]
MNDVLGYEGKRAVVTGAASGMGAAATDLLVELGAHVTALDVKPVERAGVQSLVVDLRDRAAIDAAVDAVAGPVDAVFSVAGLPGAPFSDVDTVTVNFIAARHLIESLLPKMAPGSAAVCVASNAGLGWQQELEQLVPFVSATDFEGAVAWCEENPKAIYPGYLFSKKALNAWVAWRGTALVKDGIRLNCTNPGPTDTPMMPTFEEQAGKEIIDAFVGPSGRRSTAVEQAWPLLFLNSARSSYVAAEALHVDGGFLGAMTTGQL